MTSPPFSKSADNNKDHILQQLRNVLSDGNRVLEIASGTGQHAVHFAQHMPDIQWQPSDRDLEAFAIEHALADAALPNVLPPITLDINHWPNLRPKFDAVYSANCIHVTDWNTVEDYVAGVGRSLKTDGLMLLYGPFKYDGAFTTESNASFNTFLEETYEGGGIRDFEAVDALALEAGMQLVKDVAMPANNQFIVWQKKRVER